MKKSEISSASSVRTREEILARNPMAYDGPTNIQVLARRAKRDAPECSCKTHPQWGVEVNYTCPVHGTRCEHGKLADEYCEGCCHDMSF
jgi:hypothetical protein